MEQLSNMVARLAPAGHRDQDARRRQRAREAGFDHHIVKPLEFDRLQRLLGRIE